MNKLMPKAFALILIIVFCTIVFGSCAHNETIGNVTVDKGHFEKKIDVDDISFREVDTKDGGPLGYMPINKTIAQGSDKLAAALHLFTVAEHNYYRANYIAKVSLGGGNAEAIGMKGSMKVRSLYIKEPTRSYSQSVGRVYESDPESLLTAAQIILDQGKRTFIKNRDTDDEIIYKQEPKNSGGPTMIDEFPYAECDFAKGKLKTVSKGAVDDDDFSLKYKGELTNFVISEDSLLKDSYTVVYNEDDDIYTVSFEIDVTTQDARDAYTERPRASLRKASTSNDLEYLKYKITIELWDNGTLKTFTTEEQWEATLILTSFAKPHGASQSESTDYFSWDKEDCLIDEYVKEGILSIDWAK